MSAEDKMKRAGFHRKRRDGGDSCQFCEYNDKDNNRCTYNNVGFWDGFSHDAGEYICNNCDCSEFNSLIDDFADFVKKNP